MSDTYVDCVALHRDLIISLVRKIYNSYKSNISDLSGSLNYPSEGPITSDKDCHIVDTIIQTKSYVLLKSGTHNTVYTVGLWLLFGLPELIFVNYADNADNALNTIISSYIQHYSARIVSSVIRDINKIRMVRSYDYKGFVLNGLHFERLAEDDYLKYDTNYMIWFYSYYMEAEANRSIVVADQDAKYIDKDDGLEFNLFPVYCIKLSEYKDADKLDTAKQIEQLMDTYISWTYDDFSTDSDRTDSYTDTD